MLSTKAIAEGVKTVAEDYPVKSVRLFGSYAYGEPTENSDIDLLMEFNEPDVSLFVLSGLQIRIKELLGIDVIEVGRTISIYEI